MKSADLSISVIMPVYNGARFLEKSLGALCCSDYKNFNIIVVDDGSTDNSADMASAKGALVIRSESRQSGPAAARNLAAKVAQGDIILFVDADVVVKSDTISKIAVAFQNDSGLSALFGSYDDTPAESNFLSQYKNLQHHFVHQSSNREASTFWAGLGAIRRDVFLSVGGFDCDQFREPSIEDIELGVRLRQAGHRILLDKEIQVTHLKKWQAISLLRTEIFCRALPWSKLILTRQGMINDMNLKTSDRLSALLIALVLFIAPFTFWKPILLAVAGAAILAVVFLNRDIFSFYYRSRGIVFAVLTFPWLVAYFIYSGASFGFCWIWYALPVVLRLSKRKALEDAR